MRGLHLLLLASRDRFSATFLALVMLLLAFELLVHNLQAMEGLLGLFVLGLLESHFRLDALQLLLDNLDVILGSALIVLQLGLLGLLSGL